jgi:hypothetical protein
MEESEAKPAANPEVNAVPPKRQPRKKAPTEPPVAPEIPAAPANESKTTCCPDQTPVWKMVLEVCAVIVGASAVAIYGGQLWVMNGQLEEMSKQFPEIKKSADAAKEAADVTRDTFNLTKRRTEESDEAIVSVRGETIEDGGMIYRVTIANNGKTAAHSVTAHIEISQRVLPSEARQRTLAVFDISQDELRVDTPILKEFVLSDFGASDWNRIHALRESIRIEGRLSYENGFDERRNPASCQELLTQPNPPGSAPPSMNVLVDCDRLPSFLPPLYKRLREMNGH